MIICVTTCRLNAKSVAYLHQKCRVYSTMAALFGVMNTIPLSVSLYTESDAVIMPILINTYEVYHALGGI